MVVMKKSGSVKNCVDLKPLNESVLCKVHLIPCVDKALSQLAGVTVFTKLDANSGATLHYHQNLAHSLLSSLHLEV